MSETKQRKKMSLSVKFLIGMLLGVILGFVLKEKVTAIAFLGNI